MVDGEIDLLDCVTDEFNGNGWVLEAGKEANGIERGHLPDGWNDVTKMVVRIGRAVASRVPGGPVDVGGLEESRLSKRVLTVDRMFQANGVKFWASQSNACGPAESGEEAGHVYLQQESDPALEAYP
jgi:hypothetical protein